MTEITTEEKSKGDSYPEPSLKEVMETLRQRGGHLKGKGNGSVRLEGGEDE